MERQDGGTPNRNTAKLKRDNKFSKVQKNVEKAQRGWLDQLGLI